MTNIHLNWQGPFWLDTPSNREAFTPPEQPGVYLWCVGGKKCPHIAYIGMAGDIQARLHDHMFSMLGGRYYLFSDAHLLHGKPPYENVAYEGSFKGTVNSFIGKSDEFMPLALRNLMSFGFFWATISSYEVRIRKGVESALISEAKRSGVHLQNVNSKLSLLPHNCPPLVINSTFKRGPRFFDIPRSIAYGTGK